MKLIAAVLLCLPLFVWAQNPQPTDEDPVVNKRAMHLAEQLRCLVCQNQSLAESNADLAVDLRRQIREQMAQGKTDADIFAFMVARYGDFVLYSPPLKSTTVVLWFGPLVMLAAGLVIVFYYIRRRRVSAQSAPLTEDERRQAQLLLAGESEDGR